MRFLTPKLRDLDGKSSKKILAGENSEQEAAKVCVHYYSLTFELWLYGNKKTHRRSGGQN
jgi:hypothetical protein